MRSKLVNSLMDHKQYTSGTEKKEYMINIM
jgi:hypothetical protein